MALLAWAFPGLANKIELDQKHSRLGFEIHTRFGQRIEGVFPRFEGWITVLPDGRHQVHLRLFTQYVEIPGKPRYTGWMRGEDFFDVQRHPVVEFISQPIAPDLASTGGSVQGRLTIRGVVREETLHVAKPECDSPGYDCAVDSRGTVLRSRYGMDKWQLALGDRVTFVLHTRLSGAPVP